MRRIVLVVLALLATAAVATAPALAATASPQAAQSAAKKAKKKAKAKAKKKPRKLKTIFVCRQGCAFSSLQKAVDAAAKGATIKVKPGTYVEGVIVKGHEKDGLTIAGTGINATKVVLEGKGAKRPDGQPAQNGIQVDGADNVTAMNMTARNFPANGFFFTNVHGYLMDHLIAAYNTAYGLFAFNSIGGRMTYSVGYGHGDSAFYVGQTPFQDNPEWTILDHLEGYENVLGYSGTNSKYVQVRNSEFWNNGAGVVPNTLESEKFQPARDGLITENLIYWNNFNYYKPESKVKPLPAATGAFNYPTGVGVVLLGTTNWAVRNNFIFGNFKWGVLLVSDPTNDKATNRDNRVTWNTTGGAFNDANGSDFSYEGAGSGNCWENNSNGATFETGSVPQPVLYPKCAGSPQNVSDPVQLANIGGYVLGKEEQESSWKKHPHPARPNREPIDGQPTT